MKKTISIILIFILVAGIGLFSAFAAPVIIPESPDTPVVVPGSGGVVSGSSGGNGGSIVIIDPNTNKPVATPVPEPTFYVIDTAPVITKSPTNESIEAGSDVVFVARANYASNITWFLTDGKTYLLASEVGTQFPGVAATGANTERLVLSNVSDKLDGWSASARFDNEVGSTWSGSAKISVAPDPNAVPSPTPTPLPTPTVAPTPTPVPANIANGTGSTAVQHGTNGFNNGSTVGNSNNTAIGSTANGDDINNTAGINGPAVSTNATTGSAGGPRNSHAGAYILAAVAGLVIIASVLIMALYMKGKISLGKFEKFLGSFGNDNDADMFDNSGEFYNPDDFKNKKDDK